MVQKQLRQPRVVLARPFEQDPGFLADVVHVVAHHVVARHQVHLLAELDRQVVELAVLAQL
eukprot:4516022-Heterocapsa_arctica.AAC.1